jgi:hypothetical protein
MSSVIRTRNGVIEALLHASIGPADLRRPLEGIPSTVPLHDALFLYGEAVQSNPRFYQ